VKACRANKRREPRTSGGRSPVSVLKQREREQAKHKKILETTLAERTILRSVLNARNRELAGALDREKAISEILRVISASPTDVQPVFDTIVRSAVALCGSTNGAVFRYEGASSITLQAIISRPNGWRRCCPSIRCARTPPLYLGAPFWVSLWFRLTTSLQTPPMTALMQ